MKLKIAITEYCITNPA